MSTGTMMSAQRHGAHANTDLAHLNQQMVNFTGMDVDGGAGTTQQVNEEVERQVISFMSAAPTRPAARSADVPYDQRTSARIGCLGWDLPKRQLEERAKEVLDHAKVPERSYTNLEAVCGRSGCGSCVDLEFDEPRSLRNAHYAIKRTAVKYTAQNRDV